VISALYVYLPSALFANILVTRLLVGDQVRILNPSFHHLTLQVLCVSLATKSAEHTSPEDADSL